MDTHAKSRGERFSDIIEQVQGGPHPVMPEDKLAARLAGRMLEEAVELALACGASVAQIHGHIADAIHNEAKKIGKFPSEMPAQYPHRIDRLGEIADMRLQLDHLAYRLGIEPHEVSIMCERTMDLLTTRAEAGELLVIDGLLYKKVARP